MFANDPCEYFKSAIITSSQSCSFFSSSTRYGLITVNSPDKLDLTYKFWYVGSIHGDTPVIFAIVAVGAIAITFEFLMPCFFT